MLLFLSSCFCFSCEHALCAAVSASVLQCLRVLAVWVYTSFIAAAALAQEALSAGSESFQPFKRECGQGLLQTCQQVGAECCGKCKCAQQDVLSLGEAFEAGTLPGLQHVMYLKVAGRRHAELFHKYQAMLNSPDTRAAAEQHLARLHSQQHSVATAWLGILPTKESYEIDNDTVKSALRFQLGVSPGPPD